MENRGETELSRPIATANFLGNNAADANSFFDKHVLLTGERDVLSTSNGAESFADALLLLLRMTKKFTVDVSNHPAPEAIRDMVATFQIHPISVVDSTPTLDTFAAILNVGARTSSEEQIVAVNSHGWVARVTSGGATIDKDCSQHNPIAALGAACLGVSEIFKILVALKPSRGELLQSYQYSFWDYEPSSNPGPRLPAQMSVDPIALVGAGAIGNGIAHLLAKLPFKGLVHVVDPQRFKKENLGTCLLMSAQHINHSKAEVLSGVIPSAKAFVGPVETFRQEVGSSIKEFPDVILNGLDNIEARREVQQMWPALAIDGAIGPVSCEVTVHPWGPNLSCLLCDYELPSHSAFAEQTLLTGISEERLKDPQALIDETDVSNAPFALQEWLRGRLGKQVCSVVSEAELEKLASEKHDKNFRPSAPFVACMSSTMVVTEFVRHLMNEQPRLATGFQFDLLVGPHNGIKKDHGRKPSCLCTTRQDIINKLRSNRASNRSAA